MIPTLEYYFTDDRLMYRWINVVNGFNMPVRVLIDGAQILLNPTERWSGISVEPSSVNLEIDPDFFVGSMKMMDRISLQ